MKRKNYIKKGNCKIFMRLVFGFWFKCFIYRNDETLVFAYSLNKFTAYRKAMKKMQAIPYDEYLVDYNAIKRL